jgi:hypothetical protein
VDRRERTRRTLPAAQISWAACRAAFSRLLCRSRSLPRAWCGETRRPASEEDSGGVVRAKKSKRTESLGPLGWTGFVGPDLSYHQPYGPEYHGIPIPSIITSSYPDRVHSPVTPTGSTLSLQATGKEPAPVGTARLATALRPREYGATSIQIHPTARVGEKPPSPGRHCRGIGSIASFLGKQALASSDRSLVLFPWNSSLP